MSGSLRFLTSIRLETVISGSHPAYPNDFNCRSMIQHSAYHRKLTLSIEVAVNCLSLGLISIVSLAALVMLVPTPAQAFRPRRVENGAGAPAHRDGVVLVAFYDGTSEQQEQA